MSTTVGKSKDELLQEIKEQQEKAEQERQNKLLSEQNDWFFNLINVSGEKAIRKAEENVLSAQSALKKAQEELLDCEQAESIHWGNRPAGTDKKATKTWSKELKKLEKNKENAQKNVQAKLLAVTQAQDSLERTTRKSEMEGFETELSSEEKTQKKVLDHAKYEPLYQHRLERLNDLITKLEEYLPATVSLVKTFADKRMAAQDVLHADPKPWQTAYDLLPKTKEVKDATDGLEKLWADTLDKNVSASPALQQVFNKIAALRKKLGESNVIDRMGDEELSPFHEKLDELETPLHKPWGKTEDPSAFAITQTLALDALEKSFTVAWEAAHDRKVEVDEKLDGAQKAITELSDIASKGASAYAITDQAVFEQQLSVIKTTYGARDFATAGDMLDQLLPALDKTRKTVLEAFEADKQAWAERQKLHPDLQKSLSEAAQQLKQAIESGGPAELVQRAKNLNERLKGLQTLTPGIKPTYADAIKSSKAAELELQAFKQALAGSATFKQDLAKAQKEVAEAAAEAQTAIENLETLLLAQFNDGTPPDLGAVLQPLKTEQKDLDSSWAQQVKTATSLAELYFETTQADYLRLAKKAADAATEGLADSVQTVKLAPARASYDKAKQQAQSVARDLMASDPEQAVDLLNMIDAADQVAGAATKPEQIQTQADELAEAALEHADAAYRASQIAVSFSAELDRQLKDVRIQLADLLKEINKISTGDVQKPYAALHETLSSQCEELSALVNTRLSKLLEAALNDVKALTGEIASARQAIENENKFLSKGRPSFGAIRNDLASLTQRLGADIVKRYTIATAADLGDKITTMLKSLGSQSLSEAEKELAKLQNAVDNVEEKAKAAEKKVKEFEELVDIATKTLDAEPFKSSAAKLAAQLKGRFEALKKDAAYEDGLQNAKTKLASLQEEIAGLLDSPKNDLGIPVLVFAGEEEAADAQRKAEQDKGKFEGEVAVLKKALKAAKDNKVDPREIEGLEEALNSAESAAKKSKSWADGREQLDGIRKRLSLLETNPQGLIISARNNLGNCNAFLKNEIKRFAQQTKDLAGKVADTDLDEQGKKAVATALGAVRGLFNPVALDPYLPVVASQDPKVDRPKRAAAREAALREIRRMIGTIESDFRLLALSDNPFEPKMAAIISGLKLALLDIENNLLVSLPA